MIGLAKVIGRIIALLVNKGVITDKEAFWVFEPCLEDNYDLAVIALDEEVKNEKENKNEDSRAPMP